MKKLYILCAAALGLAFTACDEVEEMTGLPQTHPQEAPFGLEAITVTPGNTSTVNLITLNDENAPVVLAETALDGAPEGYTLRLTAQMSKSEDFSAPVDLDVTNAGGKVTINPDSLQKVYYADFTKDPREATVYVRFAAYAVNGTSDVRMGGGDYFYGPYAFSLKPFDSNLNITDSYTLEVAIGSDFSNATSYTFSHSAASPYDDPVFSLNVEFPAADYAAGLSWRIVSAVGEVYGPAGATDTDGDLFADATAVGQMMSNPISMTINMETLMYTYKQAYPFFYTPGDSNGWNAAASQKVTTTDYVNYSGLVVVTGANGFKFNPDNGWNGNDFGLNGSLTENVADDGTISYTGAANGGANIVPGQHGLFYVTLDYGTRDLKLTYIASLGVIGDFNSWGGDVAMTPSADFLTWTSDEFEMTEGQTWKIRANGAWADSWGSSMDDLQYNGGNITCTESGKYILTLNLASVPYTATLAKQ